MRSLLNNNFKFLKINLKFEPKQSFQPYFPASTGASAAKFFFFEKRQLRRQTPAFNWKFLSKHPNVSPVMNTTL